MHAKASAQSICRHTLLSFLADVLTEKMGYIGGFAYVIQQELQAFGRENSPSNLILVIDPPSGRTKLHQRENHKHEEEQP